MTNKEIDLLIEEIKKDFVFRLSPDFQSEKARAYKKGVEVCIKVLERHKEGNRPYIPRPRFHPPHSII